MVRGLYTACSGMLLQMAKQDVIANNLANANTPGFKKQITIATAFPGMAVSRLGETKEKEGRNEPVPPAAIGWLGTGAAVRQISTDYSQGAMQKTDNPTDLAIAGKGFFVIETPQGERYTRNGSFRLNSEGIITTEQGYPVLGRSGPITVGDQQFTVDEKGNVVAGDSVVDTLRIVTVSDGSRLVRLGDDLYADPENNAQDAPQPQVLQGYLELSNVVAVKEMVEMITALRAYEANQKVIQAHDQTLDSLINRVAAV